MPRKALTTDDVRLIREAYREKKRIMREFSREGLAKKFNVGVTTIDNVIDGKSWKQVYSSIV